MSGVWSIHAASNARKIEYRLRRVPRLWCNLPVAGLSGLWHSSGVFDRVLRLLISEAPSHSRCIDHERTGMKEYSEIKNRCPSCNATIGDEGVGYIRTRDAPEMGYDRRVNVVEIGCHCGFEWRELIDPEETITRSGDDYSLDSFA